MNNAVIASGGQQEQSVIHTHIPILSQTPLPSRLPHNMEQSSLCYTVGHFRLSTLNITLCTWTPQTPLLSLPPSFPPVYHAFILSFCFVNKFICMSFLIPQIREIVCFCFSDLLHSLWQFPGPSMSLHVALFHAFWRLSNIPLCIYATSWFFRLFPCTGYCKQRCSEHWGTCFGDGISWHPRSKHCYKSWF